MFGIIKYLRDKAKAKILSSKKRVTRGAFVNLQDVRSIGFLYNITSTEYLNELSQIVDILDRSGIHYKGLAIETAKGILPQFEGLNNLPDDIQWLEDNSISYVENIYISKIGAIDSSSKDEFVKNEFDIFISFDNSDNFSMEYITRDIKAKSTIGMHNYKDSYFTIVFEGEDGTTLSFVEYLKQIFHYLSIIKSTRN